MYFIALATDYDGTIATDGAVDQATVAALRALSSSGRKLILVTGRELPDLLGVFPEIAIFDRVVVENGALLYIPSTRTARPLAPPPPPAFLDRLRAANVPISVGHSIVATWEPHQGEVLAAIHDLGLDLHITFNKGAVMVLPSGVNKATGLNAALADLGLSQHNVVAVGDAENDHVFLDACGYRVAVANALPMLKERADLVTKGARGAGVQELAARLLAEDAQLAPSERHSIVLGHGDGAKPIHLSAYGPAVLISGHSGIGKSTLATALCERMAEAGFQFCALDPEGDYQEMTDATVVGDARSAPRLDELIDLLARRDLNLVVNALGVNVEERPTLFAKLIPEIAKLRMSTGRPHWVLVDEAHHVLPKERSGSMPVMPKEMPATLLVTVHPELLAKEALHMIGSVVALGESAEQVLTAFCTAAGLAPPESIPSIGRDEVLYWQKGGIPIAVRVEGPRQAHKRHTRKYAEGDLGDERSFFFRGPHGQLNLKAQNLLLFVQMAAGVDEATWEHHRRAGDYSAWFRTSIKDAELAEEAAAIEADGSLDAAASRARLCDAVSRRYTAPANQ